MHASTKPSTYIIDGLNFIRSFLFTAHSAGEETLTADLIAWLDELGQTRLSGSDFRLILDGGYRNIGPMRTSCVSAQFAENRTADELILETAYYLHKNNTRAVVITSDLELGAKVRELGVKVMHCAKFFNSFYR
jgi:predicted RNA-binding protein with PIN domain